jgi:hypothetical protein
MLNRHFSSKKHIDKAKAAGVQSVIKVPNSRDWSAENEASTKTLL